MDSNTDADRLAKALWQQLRSLQQAGVQQLPLPRTEASAQQPAVTKTDTSVLNERALAPAPPEQSPQPEPAPRLLTNEQPELLQASSGTAIDEAYTMPKLSRKKRLETLQVIQTEVAACKACNELASTRTQTVFGVGNPEARLCFLGEAPGADEDKQGEPFVGRAGQLLTKIIEACTLRREDVYILNILKCRPPGNRNPTDTEAAACRGFLDRQLDVIQPEFIVCLGAVAVRNLLETKESVGKLRGSFHQYRDSRVAVTYHPAYLLRNPSAKKHTWDDMQMVLKEMGIELPKK